MLVKSIAKIVILLLVFCSQGSYSAKKDIWVNLDDSSQCIMWIRHPKDSSCINASIVPTRATLNDLDQFINTNSNDPDHLRLSSVKGRLQGYIYTQISSFLQSLPNTSRIHPGPELGRWVRIPYLGPTGIPRQAFVPLGQGQITFTVKRPDALSELKYTGMLNLRVQEIPWLGGILPVNRLALFGLGLTDQYGKPVQEASRQESNAATRPMTLNPPTQNEAVAGNLLPVPANTAGINPIIAMPISNIPHVVMNPTDLMNADMGSVGTIGTMEEDNGYDKTFEE